MAGESGGGGEDGYAGEGDEHAGGFAPGRFFDAKKNGEREGVDGRHADDDGGVSDVGVAQTERETELVDGDAEEAEVEEGPEVVKKWRVGSGEWRAGFAEHGKAGAEGGDGDHEKAGGYDAEGGEG